MLYPSISFVIPAQKLRKDFKIRTQNKFVLALDAASTTGWALVYCSKGFYKFFAGQLKLSKDKEKFCDQLIQLSMTYKHAFKRLKSKRIKVLVLEDTHLGINVHTFGYLSRLGGFIEGFLYYDFDQSILIKPTHARKILNIKGNARKEDIVSSINTLLGIKLQNNEHNIADALVLSLAYLRGEL
ncbi:MAG: hypothetical protein ACTSYR_02050 [Candidatus Odinarchaeia archaeon]